MAQALNTQTYSAYKGRVVKIKQFADGYHGYWGQHRVGIFNSTDAAMSTVHAHADTMPFVPLTVSTNNPRLLRSGVEIAYNKPFIAYSNRALQTGIGPYPGGGVALDYFWYVWLVAPETYQACIVREGDWEEQAEEQADGQYPPEALEWFDAETMAIKQVWTFRSQERQQAFMPEAIAMVEAMR